MGRFGVSGTAGHALRALYEHDADRAPIRETQEIRGNHRAAEACTDDNYGSR
jgi:hypothetical protein